MTPIMIATSRFRPQGQQSRMPFGGIAGRLQLVPEGGPGVEADAWNRGHGPEVDRS